MIQTNLIQNAHADLLCDAAYDWYGTRLATAGLDQKIKIWRLDEQTGDWSVEEEWKAHDAAISRLSWGHPAHGQFIASSSFDRTVRVWERSPPETSDHGLNSIGSSTRGGEPWIERALLTEAKGSVRSVQWAPKCFGMKVASIATDNHLRLYECLESGAGTGLGPASLMWSMSEDVDVPSLPLTSSASSSPAEPSTGFEAAPTLLDPSSTPPIAMALSTAQGSGSTSPFTGSPGLNTPSAGFTRPGTGNREADGGWDLSWCKDGYWGEVCAVACGINGLVKIVQFPPAQRPKAVLILDPKPSKSPLPSVNDLPLNTNSRVQSQRSSPSYAHQAQVRRGEREREYQQEPFAITSIAWAPSCGRSYHLIATGGRDGHVRIWKVRPPQPEAEESGGETSGNGAGSWSATIVADFDDHKGTIGKVEWNILGTVLTSAGNDGKVRLWRSTYGGVWRPMGTLDVVQREDTAGSGDAAMEE
ncbi:WD40 repeat-like protein [Ramaria rubella]|nr:WD40 repeat-like protein [Ramaria rubella]